MTDLAGKADDAGRRAKSSDTLDHAVRFGLVVYGLVHVVFAWLALQLAFGDSSGEASSTGALQQVAQQPLGGLVLWLIALGMAFMVVWRVLDAVFGHAGEDGVTLWRHRAADVGMTVVFGVLAYSAVSTVLGASSGSSEKSSQSLTARLLDLPAGQVVVGAVGLGTVAVGGVLVWQGLTERYMKKLDAGGHSGQESRAYRMLGKVGFAAKGVTIGIVGVLFLVSAVQHDSSESGGTDQALRELLERPFGPYLLMAMAAGIASYGLFCFVRARHLSR